MGEKLSKLKQSTVEGEERRKILYADDWFGEKEQKKVYLRYYSSPIAKKDDFYIPGISGEVVTFSGAPFKVNLAHISKQTYDSSIVWLVKSEIGVKNDIVIEKLNRELPEANYILISTPICSAADRAYEKASELMDGFVGILRLIGGSNLLRQLVREAEVDVSSSNMKTPSNLVPVPQEIDGPFATEENWMHFNELADEITSANEVVGNRITLSIQLIEKAFSSQGAIKFFNYWVAIEVAADTDSTGKIITLLANSYGKPNGYIQNDLGFQHLRETRTAVFHRGESYEIASGVERYLHCLFLDIVRSKLGLASRGCMAAMVEDGFDVKRLDRTVAQGVILTIDAP